MKLNGGFGKYGKSIRLLAAAVLLLAAAGCAQISEAPAVRGLSDNKLLPDFSANSPEMKTRFVGESVELALDPLGVWGDQKDLSSSAVLIDDNQTRVRVRNGSLWEVPHTRAGLFWHSDEEVVYLPVVVEQRQPLKIRGAEIHAGDYVATLRLAANFKFNPGESQNSQHALSHASFRLTEESLQALSKSETAILVIKTHRGHLPMGLDIVGGSSSKDVRYNARYMFSLFAREMAAIKANF